MGRIAVQNSDMAIVTSDNPRTEGPMCYQGRLRNERQYLQGRTGQGEAELAVSLAQPGDIIVLAGKTRDYQIIGKIAPFRRL